MKILHTVEFYWPSVGGAQEVVRQISERLVKLGHDVTIATKKLPERQSHLHNGVKIVEFEVDGRAATGLSGEVERYRDFLLNSDFDVMMNYAVQQWATDIAFEVIDKIKAAKVLVPCGYSRLYEPGFDDYFQKLPHILEQYGASVYLSNDYRDINFAREHKIGNLRVIPNGAGADEFLAPTATDIRKKLGISPDALFILTVGTHSGEKGHAEAIEIFREANLPKAVFVVNGNPASWRNGCITTCTWQSRWWPLRTGWRQGKRLILANLPRPELIDAYKAADIFLFPSNIEASPLVLFEAMAAKLPFLTSDVGNSKEIIEWGHGGLVLPTTKDEAGNSHADILESAKMLDELGRDSEKRGRLAAAGHTAWKQKFSWEVIAKEYEKLYQSLAGSVK